MGPLGVPELLFIFALALLIFGPKQLPQVGRTLGKGMAEFRKASNDLRRTINAELIEDELRKSDPRQQVRDTLREVKEGLEQAVVGSSEDSGGSGASAEKGDGAPETPDVPDAEEASGGAGAEEGAESPAGAVARGSMSHGSEEGAASAEAAAGDAKTAPEGRGAAERASEQ